MSLMYRQKSNGPRTEPWGTPRLVLSGSELEVPEITCNCLFCKYDLIHSKAILEKPRVFNLLNNLEGEIVSNALLKSNCSSIVTSLLFIPRLISSVSFNKAVSVLLYRLKPVCIGSSTVLLLRNVQI